jgi:hypothetical protein
LLPCRLRWPSGIGRTAPAEIRTRPNAVRQKRQECRRRSDCFQECSSVHQPLSRTLYYSLRRPRRNQSDCRDNVGGHRLSRGTTAKLAFVSNVPKSIPGPPPPPPPPCITTATLQENGFTTGSYICSVRNGGVVSHNVTIRIVNTGNDADNGNRTPVLLAPGKTTSEGFSPPSDQTSADACVVTTDEGTTDALSDLVVVLQFSDPAGETEGKIINSCASPILPPT